MCKALPGKETFLLSPLLNNDGAKQRKIYFALFNVEENENWLEKLVLLSSRYLTFFFSVTVLPEAFTLVFRGGVRGR